MRIHIIIHAPHDKVDENIYNGLRILHIWLRFIDAY